ncbi:unnamed protein product [Arabis nemorensis]|uniref:Uncharacterized protein n=1 Tax=Arabis nemorensis TaxID=586526 RepID=A0A565AST9_9BRAS|nr:unnamed protein product [Arabis nemorensis]
MSRAMTKLKPQEMSSCSWKAKIIMASVTTLPLKITHKASLDQNLKNAVVELMKARVVYGLRRILSSVSELRD